MTDVAKLPSYPVLQQRLIDARDRLDTDVGRLTRMNEFNIRVLRMNLYDSFSGLVSEALVDIFELEFGVCWLLNESGEPVGVPRVLGLEPAQGSLRIAARQLLQSLAQGQPIRRLNEHDLTALQSSIDIADGAAALICDRLGVPLLLILAGNTRRGQEIFESLSEELTQTFLVFAAQVSALKESFWDRQRVTQLNENLVSILQAIPDELFEIDTYGRYINVWEANETLLAAPVDQLTGRTIEQMLPAEAASVVRVAMEEADAKGTSIGHQMFLNLPAGERWFELSVSLKKSPGGVRTYMVLSRNITDRRETDRRLRDSESRFRRIFEQTDAIAVQGYDRERRVFYWNAASERLYGHKADAAMGQLLEDLLAPENKREDFRRELDAAIAGGTSLSAREIKLAHREGHGLQILCSHVATADADSWGEMYCIGVDISKLRSAEDRVRQLSQAVEQSPVSVVITNIDGVIEYVNRACCETSGYSEDELLGQHSNIFKSGQMSPEIFDRLWSNVVAGSDWQGEIQNRRKDGDLYWEQTIISPVVDDRGRIIKFLGVKEDITHRKALDDKILHQATYDSLTNLPNRLLVLDRLENMVETARRDGTPIAVLFLDVDDFKKVNDSLGHEVGDKVLIEAGERISSAVRGGDTVGRLGGDEFIVLLRDIGEGVNASRVAEAVIAQFRRPFRGGDREMLLTVSGGIALFPEDGGKPGDLLRKADSAMYHAKSLGKNTYAFFTDTLNQGIERRLALEEQLHGAFARNELSVVYQPKVSLESNAIEGVEALVRWCNRSLGNVPPSEFIPIAEQSGQILAIGRFVLDAAIKQAALWNRQLGRRLSIAVNLSPRQFRDAHLLSFVADTLEKNQLPADCLELEVTEGILIEGNQGVDVALDHLQMTGIRLVMDDFGTGYSSLNYLRTYPFDVLKVDRSFVRDMTSDSADRELVNAAIAMGHGLGLTVVAEGVENMEQLELLRAQGCDFAQGFYFSRPLMPLELASALGVENSRSKPRS